MTQDDNDSKETRKRQSTLDESNIEVPDSKKIRTDTVIPEEVKAEEEPDSVQESVEIDDERKAEEKKGPPSQKGLIYFFFRPKVDHERIDQAVDAQRSYIILRPLPEGAVLEDKTKVDDLKLHILELPKKILPEQGDQFMAFVAKGQATTQDVRDYLSSNTYSTKTRGERTTPAARPSGQGVYNLAEIENATHLAYKLTTPNQLGEVQWAFGILDEGSFVLSTKNPESKSSGNQLPGNANFPESLQKAFGSRSWLPTTAEHLEYDNTGLLLIGKKQAVVGDRSVDQELEKLEEEDKSRESLKLIFHDLGISLQEHESTPLLGEFA